MNLFGSKVPVRDDSGEITGMRTTEVSRMTKNTLGPHFCKDKDRRLIVSLRDGDIIAVKPERLSAKETLTITAQDLYGYMMRCHANRLNLERARAKKESKAIRLARQRQERAEKRLVRL